MNFGSSRYPRGQANSRDKQVNRRARALPAEYRGLLRKLDSAFHDTRPGEVGPCQARFETLGGILELVVGAFGEVSADLDRLITVWLIFKCKAALHKYDMNIISQYHTWWRQKRSLWMTSKITTFLPCWLVHRPVLGYTMVIAGSAIYCPWEVILSAAKNLTKPLFVVRAGFHLWSGILWTCFN